MNTEAKQRFATRDEEIDLRYRICVYTYIFNISTFFNVAPMAQWSALLPCNREAAGHKSGQVFLGRGVRQGDPLSSALFNLTLLSKPIVKDGGEIPIVDLEKGYKYLGIYVSTLVISLKRKRKSRKS